MSDQVEHENIVMENAGAHGDTFITGSKETGKFQTDEPPTSETPANGSSNAGINKLHGNREKDDA
ncbi:hypothetical protein [Paractinoplanes toevensis]|uniref:Uncharacterized protein n=1 Tax=Paractinoplanes toevensis TaxID=571911 RepID=A0A919W5P6_9ACTN|nr:hypothetical protein [Actinoplanes toevensis]GIM93275.1 hypothetical protein Ato02nite_050680 [Actinoplanes toevensis]